MLSESEPFYEGSAERSSANESSGQRPRDPDGGFRVDLPDERVEEVRSAVGDPDRFDTALEELTDRIEAELQRIFGLETDA